MGRKVIALCKNFVLAKNFTLALGCISAMAFMGVFSSQPLQGQQIRVAQPFQTAGDSYYERFGVNFGMNFGGGGRIRGLSPAGQILPRVQLTQGSAAGTAPAFGGYNPNSPLRTGITRLGGDVGFSLGIVAGKGNRRSMTSQTPSVMVQNGQSGSIFSGANRPFVTSLTPVNGGMRMPTIIARPLNPPSLGPLNLDAPVKRYGTEERTYSSQNSTATQGALSIQEIRRRKQLEANGKAHALLVDVNDLIEAAETAEGNGSFGAARAKYNRALRKLGDDSEHEELRVALMEKLAAIKSKR